MASSPYYTRFLALFLFISLSSSCQRRTLDTPEENYNELFPFTGISKPQKDKWNISPRPCTPDAELSSYIYNPLLKNAGSHVYTVTLRCIYKETRRDGTLETTPSSRYRVMFINEYGQYQTITSDNSAPAFKFMVNGTELTHSFQVRSGYPLYISVHGLGPRASSISAHISATSSDGLISIDPIGTFQVQNEEGPNYIKQPYCEYLILP